MARGRTGQHRQHLKEIVIGADGAVKRIRGVDPKGKFVQQRPGYGEIPVAAPLTDEQVAEFLPTLGLAIGDALPSQRGKMRECRAL